MTDAKNNKESAVAKMPPFLYGTAWKKERTAELVVKAVTFGFRGIDTACQPKHYNEAGVGEALETLSKKGIKREALFLQTKFTPLGGQDPARTPYDKTAPLGEQVAQSFAVSKHNLRSDYVDSLVLHSPLATHSQLMMVWKAMEAIYDEGGAKLLGISNCYDLKELKALYGDAKVKPAVVQNRFYQDTGYDKLLRQWCDEQGVIYQSFWTLSANPHILASSTIKKIAKEFSKTEPQIFFRYLTQIGVLPLIGSCSERHMQQDLAIFDFELPPAYLQQIALLLC